MTQFKTELLCWLLGHCFRQDAFTNWDRNRPKKGNLFFCERCHRRYPYERFLKINELK